MRQTHLLWLIRFVLYRQWRRKADRHLTRNVGARAATCRVEGHLGGPAVVAAPTQPHVVDDVLRDEVLPPQQ